MNVQPDQSKRRLVHYIPEAIPYKMDEGKVLEAQKLLEESPLCVRTGLLKDCLSLFMKPEDAADQTTPKLSLKLEHMQNFGSFKIRGVVNQFDKFFKNHAQFDKELVTMSAGNYGRAFAEACQHWNVKGRVLMPESAPLSRVKLIESKGLTVERVPTSQLQNCVDRHVAENGSVFFHSFDDPLLMDGYGSIALEILEEVPDADIILTCCGGGGMLAGISAVAKAKSYKCRVYGVEPETANCMFRSFEAGEAVSFPESASIASGLSPPYAGKITYEICKQFVDSILLVSEDELRSAMKILYNRGLVVEPAGAAAFAAFIFNKIPEYVGNKSIVVVLSGRNVEPDELCELLIQK